MHNHKFKSFQVAPRGPDRDDRCIHCGTPSVPGIQHHNEFAPLIPLCWHCAQRYIPIIQSHCQLSQCPKHVSQNTNQRKNG